MLPAALPWLYLRFQKAWLMGKWGWTEAMFGQGSQKQGKTQAGHCVKPHLHQHRSPGSPWFSPAPAAGQGAGMQPPGLTPHCNLVRGIAW
jgi:hypothetical protein